MDKNFEKYIEVLQKNPLFNGIDPKDYSLVLDRLNSYIRFYSKDEYIRHIGDRTDFFGIVLSGEIHVFQYDIYGNRNITASIGEGALFAEAFVCAGVEKFPVDICASSDSTLMFINSRVLFSSCEKGCVFHYQLIRNLLGIVARKNMFLNQKLRYISRKTTREKILAYLNDQAKQNGSDSFTIPFNRQELADFLGVERSAMSVEIGKLVRQGMIETKRSYFRLLERAEGI